MVECEVIFDGSFIYLNSLTIERGCFEYFITNSEGVVVKDFVTLEEAVKYCMEN